MRWKIVSTTPKETIPAPQAMPTAAETQMVAAVVSPRTTSLPLKMTPAPKKPIPLTIWAAMRDGSRTAPGSITKAKP